MLDNIGLGVIKACCLDRNRGTYLSVILSTPRSKLCITPMFVCLVGGILNRCCALRRLLNAQLLLHLCKEGTLISFSRACANSVAGDTCAEEVVEPELIFESWFELEELRLPVLCAASGELLVEADACGRTIDLGKGALLCDTAVDCHVRTEGIADFRHLTSRVHAELPHFRSEQWIADVTNGPAAAAAIFEPPCVRKHLLLVEVCMDRGLVDCCLSPAHAFSNGLQQMGLISSIPSWQKQWLLLAMQYKYDICQLGKNPDLLIREGLSSCDPPATPVLHGPRLMGP
jgi:hypothetical protein